MRQIGVSYSGFVDESYTLLSLFDDVEQIEKDNRLQTAIDVVREQFGFLAIQKGTVLTEGSRNIERRWSFRGWIGGIKMKQEKNTVQFSEIRSKGCNDIEMLERFLHGIVETATSKLRQRKLKTTEISIRLVHAKSENRLPLEFTFSIKPTSSSVIIYTEVINRFKECYTGGGIQGFTIQFDKNTLASA